MGNWIEKDGLKFEVGEWMHRHSDSEKEYLCKWFQETINKTREIKQKTKLL